MSPHEKLQQFIDDGWVGKVAVQDSRILELAFAATVERKIDCGVVTFSPRRGQAIRFYHDDLLGRMEKVMVRVPVLSLDCAFVYDMGGNLICRAEVEQTFGVLDPAGAQEGKRRNKTLQRKIGEKRSHIVSLGLVEDTRRNLKHMPAAPKVPVAANVNIDPLEDMKRLEASANTTAIEAPKPENKYSQWSTGPNEILDNFEWGED